MIVPRLSVNTLAAMISRMNVGTARMTSTVRIITPSSTPPSSAEIAVQRVADVMEELHGQRLVEPVDLVELGDLGGGGLEPERGTGGAARLQMGQQKGQQRHAEYDQRSMRSVAPPSASMRVAP